MKKSEWFIVILPLILTWFVDHITKLWASNLSQIVSMGPLHLALHHNHGAMLGLFSELPTILRVVTLSTGGAFLLCTYALIQYLLPIKSLMLRVGLSILIGGICGNVTDRILWGYVVDFLVIGTPSFASPAFNFADALQWVGYGFIVYAIVRDGDKLWPERDVRRKYWVNDTFQLKYCFILMGVGLGLTIIGIVYSYTYLRVTMQELSGSNPAILNKFLTPFLITYFVLAISFCVILFSVGKILSHRIAGPLYAFERFLKSTLDGKPAVLKLRSGDEFRHLESLAEQVSLRLNQLKTQTTKDVTTISEEEN